MHITHYEGKNYLILIDCNSHVIYYLATAALARFSQYNWPFKSCILQMRLTEYTAFCNKLLEDFLKEWCIHLRFHWMYVPSGNGIVERCYQSIKWIAVRKPCSLMEVLYWYNVTLRDNISLSTAWCIATKSDWEMTMMTSPAPDKR